LAEEEAEGVGVGVEGKMVVPHLLHELSPERRVLQHPIQDVICLTALDVVLQGMCTPAPCCTSAICYFNRGRWRAKLKYPFNQ
jgi:hypothetical protein